MRFSIRGSGTEAAAPSEGAHPTAQPTGVAPPDDVGASQVAVQVIPEGGEVVSSGNPWVLVLRTFAQNKLAIIGVAFVILIVLFSYVGPLIYYTDQFNPDINLVHTGPTGAHLIAAHSSGVHI